MINWLIPTPSLMLGRGNREVDALSGPAAPVLHPVLLLCVHEVHRQTGLSAPQHGLSAWLATPTSHTLLPARFCRACTTYFIEYFLYSRITLLHIRALAVTFAGMRPAQASLPACTTLRLQLRGFGRPLRSCVRSRGRSLRSRLPTAQPPATFPPTPLSPAALRKALKRTVFSISVSRL